MNDDKTSIDEGVDLARKLNEWLAKNPGYHLKRSGKEAVIIKHHVEEFR